MQGLLHPGQGPGAGPVDAVLGQQAEVAAGQDAFGAAPGELVEGGEGLGEESRLTQRHRGDARAQADAVGAAGRRGEEEPEVLVPGLVGGVTGVEPELVGEPDRLQGLGQRVVGEHRVAELHERQPPSWGTVLCLSRGCEVAGVAVQSARDVEIFERLLRSFRGLLAGVPGAGARKWASSGTSSGFLFPRYLKTRTKVSKHLPKVLTLDEGGPTLAPLSEPAGATSNQQEQPATSRSNQQERKHPP